MPPSFGTGSVLWSESFTYSDGNAASVASSAWSKPVTTGDAARDMRIVSNALMGDDAAGWSGIYSVKSDFADGDYIFTLTAPPADTLQMLIYFLGVPEGSGGITAYAFNMNKVAGSGPNDRTRFQRWSGSSVAQTFLDVTTQEWIAGDQIGVRIIDSGATISLWKKDTGGGSWTQLGTDYSPSVVLTSGSLMFETNSGAMTLDSVEYRSNEDTGDPLAGSILGTSTHSAVPTEIIEGAHTAVGTFSATIYNNVLVGEIDGTGTLSANELAEILPDAAGDINGTSALTGTLVDVPDLLWGAILSDGSFGGAMDYSSPFPNPPTAGIVNPRVRNKRWRRRWF